MGRRAIIHFMSAPDDQAQTCAGCGRAFTCGNLAGWEHCWCADLPALPTPPEAGKGCYCPDCMQERLAEAGVKRS